jgi:hypothetical protein
LPPGVVPSVQSGGGLQLAGQVPWKMP